MTALVPELRRSPPSKAQGGTTVNRDLSLSATGSRTAMSRPTELFVHVTGDVTNPVPLENILMEDPVVRSAILFGYGRYNAGALIELKEGHHIDTNDHRLVEETRNKLVPTVERMNMFAPQHSRIYKEMTIFASRTKPFSYSYQGTVNRQSTLAGYTDDINALYDTTEQAALIGLKYPKVWSPENSLHFVRGIVVALWGKKIDDDADFFHYGADSIQATRIRMILFRALRTTAKVDTRKFSGSIVYQYPTISSLAAFATRAARGCLRHQTEIYLTRCIAMNNMVKTYTSSFPEYQPETTPPHDDVVLITGTTGLFGSNLLAEFLASGRVSRVYAVNYKSHKAGSLAERQEALLGASGLDPGLVHHRKLTLLEADVSGKHLGLSQELYDEVLSATTHIVHNAWLSTFDDGSPLSVFDNSVRTLRDLITFALSSPLPVPPRLMFISTTDTLRNTHAHPSPRTQPSQPPNTDKDPDERAQEVPASPYDAAGSAYGESKWVGEQILAAAASKTPLRPIVVRLGQMCGGVNGRWREGDRFPMMVQLSVELGALPIIDEEVSWIPVHFAAKAVAEMRNSLSTYLHVEHPTPVSLKSLLRCIGEELGIPLIPLPEWTAKLEQTIYRSPHPPPSARPGEDIALTILQHLRRVAESETPDHPARVFKQPRLSSEDAWFTSPTLRGGMNVLGSEDVRLWVEHWRDIRMVPGEPGGP